MIYRSIFAFSACIAVVALGCIAAAPVAASIGLLASACLAMLAPAPFRFVISHPRSIFETRRAGLL